MPIAASFSVRSGHRPSRDTKRSVARNRQRGGRSGARSTGSLRAEPARAAILTDVDGTLAPIVDRPDQAAVPDAAREALIALSGRFGLVGCVSGRQAEEAKRLVGVEEIAYAGNHGLELLLPGEDGPQLDPSVRDREQAAAEFVAAHSETVEAAGLRIEDKGPIQALHWRGADDERAAEARAHELAAEGGRAGLEPRWGRKVLELRPAGGGGKDAAVAALLATDGIRVAALRRRRPHRPRRLPPPARAARRAASSRARSASASPRPEAPPELAEESDWTVDGPERLAGGARVPGRLTDAVHRPAADHRLPRRGRGDRARRDHGDQRRARDRHPDDHRRRRPLAGGAPDRASARPPRAGRRRRARRPRPGQDGDLAAGRVAGADRPRPALADRR